MITQEEFRAGILNHMEKDEWDKAAIGIAKCFHEDPNDLEIRSICGLIYSFIGANEIPFQPLTSEEFLWRGISGRSSRNFLETLRDFGTAINLNPQNHLAYKWSGKWFKRIGLYKEAREKLLKALEISEQAEYYHDLGRICNDANDYESALFYHKKSLELNPTYDPYLVEIGYTYKLMGQIDNAQEIFDRLNITPQYFEEGFHKIED